MVIKFLCPNGHQLSAPENMTGKKGKCPKCQSAFVVPSRGEAPTPELVPGPAALEQQMVTGGEQVQTPAMGSGKGLPAGAVFVFLCPNGHKLNGPPSLKGKPGQCPHCGARFRIPSDEDIAAAEAEEELPTGEAEVDEEPSSSGSGEARLSGSFHFPHEQYASDDSSDATVQERITRPPPGAAGMGYIFARLWERKDADTEVEIYLNEGEIIAPDQYSESLSKSDYGVFAIREGDGSYAVTVIPWSAVRRVGVRKMVTLPDELFAE
jgi:hypothetical protein